ncbi:MAG: PAS domain S-box protein [Methanoregulaceae archaeon]|jgi:PAS domain S-box-containing protein|nr:PAS domain S-box protein [Methanoregulaceae archaeon]
MQPISPKKLMVIDICIIISTICAIFITWWSLSLGIYDVFPFFYIIPLVLIAFAHPKLSIYGTVLLGWVYLVLVFMFGLPDARVYTIATIWFYIFVSLGVLISTYSKAYRREGEKNCGLYYNSQAGAFSYDKISLKINNANQKFCAIVGYNCEDLKKKALRDIIPDTDAREKFLAQIYNQHRIRDIEVGLLAADGSLRWALVSAVDCETRVIICTVVDITEQKQAQEALFQANKKLNLLNNVTRHDILNQLTVLIGYLELSRDDATDPQLLTYISKEEQAAEAIKKQILFTRDYQNIGVHSPGWYNIWEIVSLALAAIDVTGVRVTVDLPPVEIYADPLLEKVFYNLIENSIRHGEHVTEIAIRSVETPEGLILVLEDNGAGIPVTEKEKIFRREYFKNTGFGLFLGREILAITNLTIQENGVPGSGARFEIFVPNGAFRSGRENGAL